MADSRPAWSWRSPSVREACPCRATTTAWTWAVTEQNPPIADGLELESGTLQLFNYADYIDPATVKKFEKQFDTDVKIGTTTPRTRRSRSSRPAQVDFDVVIGLGGERIVQT